MKKAVLANAVLVLIAGALLAQSKVNPPSLPDPTEMAQHHIQMLTAMLNLTTAQQQQATSIFTNAAATAATLHDGMKSAHQALDTAVGANDAGAIDQAAATIGQLTSQMIGIQAKAQAAFVQILTPDQSAKLAQMKTLGPHVALGPMGINVWPTTVPFGLGMPPM